MTNLKLLFRNRDDVEKIKSLVPAFLKSMPDTKKYVRICKACCKYIGNGVYCGACFNRLDEAIPPIWMNNGLFFWCNAIQKKYKEMAYRCNELEYESRMALQRKHKTPMEESHGTQRNSG